MNTGDQAVKSSHGLLTTIACGPRGEVAYALEAQCSMVVPPCSGCVTN